MAKPVIMTVDDDRDVLAAVTRDLQAGSPRSSRSSAMPSAPPALQRLACYALRGRPVAMIISDQVMPGMTGIELLERAKREAPEAKLVLLTAYADTDVAIRAINDIQLDHYLMKPWDPPEEKLYPIVDDLLRDWRRRHRGDRPPRHDRRPPVVGAQPRAEDLPRPEPRALRVVRSRARRRGAAAARPRACACRPICPSCSLPDGEPLRVADAARCRRCARAAHERRASRCTTSPSSEAGPAGLAAAVYGASEGLRRVRRSKARRPAVRPVRAQPSRTTSGSRRGSPARTSPHRAMDQVRRFEAEMVLAREVVGFEARGPVRAVRFADGTEIEARALLVATGVSYRRLEAPGVERAHRPRRVLRSERSAVRRVRGRRRLRRRRGELGRAGGGEPCSLRPTSRVARARPTRSRRACPSTSSSGSGPPNVEVRLQTEVVAGAGGEHLEGAHARRPQRRHRGATSTTNWLFVFIGASPRTDWLGDDVARDEKGFVDHRAATCRTQRRSPRWPLDRSPSCSRRACPACSPPATCASTR